MLPFIGRAHVAYLPNDKVIGLSKIPRIVDMFSHRLQVQERMTRQIADFMNILLKPRGVAVVVEAVHMCAMLRGVKKHDARMTILRCWAHSAIVRRPAWNFWIIFHEVPDRWNFKIPDSSHKKQPDPDRAFSVRWFARIRLNQGF